MTSPVDLLAVLRFNAKEATKKWGPDNQDAAALAVTVQLIEAMSELVDHAIGCEILLKVEFTETLTKARSALARVKGASA